MWQKTYYPRILIKTFENSLILSKNQDFHPKLKSVAENTGGRLKRQVTC